MTAGTRRGPGRAAIVSVMLVALICAGLTRNLAVAYHDKTSAIPGTAAPRSVLGGMNSFALALLLGGLRGPLVMILWATSESQKVEKNLEDFDTKVEWIRNLQPEFDTVHMFQMWNKAYNISVQLASLPNRYAAILDALDYGRSVDAARPDNINILHQTAQIYSNKLGTVAQEKSYYRRRVREDSLPRQTSGPKFGEAGFQRRRMDPLLDEKFEVLPEYLVVRHPRPADLPKDAEWNSGAEMQFLPQYAPYPYGVSTYALAYNYSKRAEVLMNVGKQKPLQLSESVIDSRPALELKAWAEDDWERGRVAELKLFGIAVPTDRIKMEMPTAAVPTNRQPDPAKKADYDLAVYSYDTAARMAGEALREYERHLAKPEYFDKQSIYQSHVDSMAGIRQLATADKLYLQAMNAADATGRASMLRDAAAAYRKSIELHELIIVKYYIDDEVMKKAFGGVERIAIAGLTPEKRHELLVAAQAETAKVQYDSYSEDRGEYETYIRRATERLKLIGS